MLYEDNSVATDARGLWPSLDLRNLQNGLLVLVPNIYTPYQFYNPEKKLFIACIGLAFRLNEKSVIREQRLAGQPVHLRAAVWRS